MFLFLRLVASPTLIKNPIEIQKNQIEIQLKSKKNQIEIELKSKKIKKIKNWKIKKNHSFLKKSNWNPIEIEKNQKRSKKSKNQSKKIKKIQKIQNKSKNNPKKSKKSKQKPIFLMIFWNDFSNLIHNRIEIQLKS